MPRGCLTRVFAVPETSAEGWGFSVHLVPLSPCTFLKVVVRKTNTLTECFKQTHMLATPKALGSLLAFPSG